MASATRDSSPPDAMRASGRGGSPGFGASRNSTWSAPLRSSDAGTHVDRERPVRESRGPGARRSRRRPAARLQRCARWSAAPQPRPQLPGAPAPGLRVALGRPRGRATGRPPRGSARRARGPPPPSRRTCAAAHRACRGALPIARGPGRRSRDPTRPQELGRDVLDLRLDPFQPAGQLGEPSVQARQLGRGADARGRPGRANRLRPTSTSWASPASRVSRSAFAAAPSRPRSVVDLAGARRRSVDLGRGVVGQLQPPRELCGINVELAQRCLVLAPRPDGVGNPVPQIAECRQTRRAGLAERACQAAVADRAGRGSRPAARRFPRAASP